MTRIVKIVEMCVLASLEDREKIVMNSCYVWVITSASDCHVIIVISTPAIN